MPTHRRQSIVVTRSTSARRKDEHGSSKVLHLSQGTIGFLPPPITPGTSRHYSMTLGEMIHRYVEHCDRSGRFYRAIANSLEPVFTTLGHRAANRVRCGEVQIMLRDLAAHYALPTVQIIARQLSYAINHTCRSGWVFATSAQVDREPQIGTRHAVIGLVAARSKWKD